jgi:hypothetical protein
VETELKRICARICPPSVDALAAARVHLNPLTKPLGSLGRLEDIAAQWGSIRQQSFADSISKAVYVFAADHGVRAEGDSRIGSYGVNSVYISPLAATPRLAFTSIEDDSSARGPSGALRKKRSTAAGTAAHHMRVRPETDCLRL